MHRRSLSGENKWRNSASITPRRRRWAVPRRHLLEHIPVSELCEELGLRPTVFYRWQKEFFENGAAAFGRHTLVERGREQQRVAALEQKLQRRNEILAELIDEHLALKTGMGSP